MSAPELTVRIASSVGNFDREEWNALGGSDNPFVSHEFLTAMEDSGSVGPGTGWEPAPIAITDDAGSRMFVCSDTEYCNTRQAEGHRGTQNSPTSAAGFAGAQA